MEVILLERVAKLGQMGDVVRVKDGLPATSSYPRAKHCGQRQRTAHASRI